MRSHVKLGRILGIEVGLHYSWLLIATMLTLSLAAHFEVTHPEWESPLTWATALLTTVLFFLTLVTHELAHALAAKWQGLPVPSVTIFALGGVAQMQGEPATAGGEFRMAIAGPLVSALIGAGSLGLAAMNGWEILSNPSHPVEAVLVWLGYINFSLAIFNMIPGYPLDGGRVLRAIVWRLTGNAHKSLRVTARLGRLVAALLMAAGVTRFATGSGMDGLWITFIGWFLFDAAGRSYAQLRVTELLRGLRVGDLMARDTPHVDGWTNLQVFIEENLLQTVRFCYVVTNNGQPAGLISPREIQMVPQLQWRFKTISDVMQPLDDSPTISPEAPVLDALETMGREDISQLPVAADGRIEGVISRAIVLGFLEAHGHLRP